MIGDSRFAVASVAAVPVSTLLQEELMNNPSQTHLQLTLQDKGAALRVQDRQQAGAERQAMRPLRLDELLAVAGGPTSIVPAL